MLLMLVSTQVKTQSWLKQAYSLAKKENWEMAIGLAEKNLDTLPEDTTRASLLHDVGYWYSKLNNLEFSSQFYEKALLLEEKMKVPRLDKLALIYNNIAYNSSYLHDYSKVIEFYKKAHEIWYTHQYQNISNNITAFGNLITELIDLGLKREAELYFNKMETYVAEINAGQLRQEFSRLGTKERTNRLMFVQLTRVRYYCGLGGAKELADALAQFEQLIRLPHFPDDRAMYLEALDLGGFSERFAGRYDAALKWYKKEALLAHNDFYRMKGAANQAVVYYFAGNMDKALSFNKQALSFFPENTQNGSVDPLWAMQAEIMAARGNKVESIRVLEALFNRQLKRRVVQDEFSCFTTYDFEGLIYPGQISVFLFAGNAYLEMYAHDRQSKNYLLQAHHFYVLAATHFTRFYSREGFTEALEALRNRINGKLLETGILLELSQQEWLTILSRIENNASRHTWKKLLRAHANSLDIPAEWLKERQRLMSERELSISNSVVDGKVRRQKVLSGIDSLNRLIQAKAPRFLAFDTAEVSLARIRRQLPVGHMLLRFFVTEKQVYGVALTGQNLLVKRLGATIDLRKLSLEWCTLARNPKSSIREASRLLYDKFLAPFEPLLMSQQALLLVPEAYFGLVSFEALLNQGLPTSPNKPLPVYYAYDVKIQELQRQFVPGSEHVVAFAPVYQTYQEHGGTAEREGLLHKLPYARSEAEYVSRLLKGTFYEGTNATRKNFLASIGKYGLYHLAMHALMDTIQYDRSCLIFSNDQRLYFYELYEKPFCAELVVLSACNTGVGLLEAGEGAMGLSRALAFSGVQSCVYALWDIPDKETSEIIAFFYEALKNGESKQVALAHAKARFLALNPEKTHPYFWAGLVLNGNPDPVTGTSKSKVWVVVACLIFGLFLLLFVLYYKYKKQDT